MKDAGDLRRSCPCRVGLAAPTENVDQPGTICRRPGQAAQAWLSRVFIRLSNAPVVWSRPHPDQSCANLAEVVTGLESRLRGLPASQSKTPSQADVV